MDALSQLKGSLSDRYEIEREIGAGGMATVYLAHDLRHDRPVALKLLNPELGAVLGVERFLAEIKVTANLQHPNLLPLFDSGAADGLLYYVMPFVEGETLRARLNREKQLPVDEAVRMTVAIANALDYAHSHGVIHRDLKPENILLQHGQPVIADFGIALAVSNAGGNRITQTGLSLGTPQYMSPEQATGDRVIDGRSDIYSLGAVAYEMLTGEPPHTGSTSQAIIARMLTEKPRPMRVTRPSIPEYVEFAVLHALEKLPADRFSTAREFADAIQGKGATASTGLHSFQHAGLRGAAATSWRSRLLDPLTLGLTALALGAVAFAAFHKPGAPVSQRVVRYILATVDSLRPGTNTPWPGAMSPDGGVIVYSPAHASFLYSLRTDQLDPRPIPGTEGANQPMFSPDGQWLAFESNGKLRKVRLDGSAPTAITDAQSENGGDWTSRDEIVLGSESSLRGLSLVSAAGGELTQFAKPDKSKGETDYVWPIATPDGSAFAFVIWTGSLASAKLATVSLKGTDVVELGVKGVRPLGIIDGTLVYVQMDGSVMGLPLDRSLRKRAGNPTPVLDPVDVPQGTNGNSEIFVSKGGGLLTSRGGTNSQLSWISPNGSPTPVISDIKSFGVPRLSPDGRRIAVGIKEDGKISLWLRNLGSGTFSRLSSIPGSASPEWSSDGTRIYFIGLDEKQQFAIWVQSAEGLIEPQKVVATLGFAGSLSVARDNKSIVYVVYSDNSWNLFRLPLDSPSAGKPYIATHANEVSPALSPDGRWLAYTSDQAGRDEIFLRSYPNPNVGVQVSAAGGREPRWSDDGTKIYYRWNNNLLAAKLSKPGMNVIARDTVLKSLGSMLPSGTGVSYDIAKDGRLIGRIGNRDDYQLIIVPNWRAELQQKLAAGSH